MKKLNAFTILFIALVGLSVLIMFTSGFLLGSIALIATIGIFGYLKRANILCTLASSYFENNNIEKSFETYEKVITMPSCPTLGKIVYAYRLLSNGHTDRAMKILNDIDQSNFTDEEKFNFDATYAVGLWKEGDLKQAIRILEETCEKRESPLLYETLGYLYLCNKNYKKALTFNEKAYAFSDVNPTIKENLATSYYYNRKDKSAVKLYKELINDSTTFPEPYYYYALLLSDKEKYDLALKYLHMALEKKQSFLSELKHEHIQHMIDEIDTYLAETKANEVEDSDTEPDNESDND